MQPAPESTGAGRWVCGNVRLTRWFLMHACFCFVYLRAPEDREFVNSLDFEAQNKVCAESHGKQAYAFSWK